MPATTFDPLFDDETAAPKGAGALVAIAEPEAANLATSAVVEAQQALVAIAVVAQPDDAPEQPIGVQDLQIMAASEDRIGVTHLRAPGAAASAMQADGVDAAQIDLRDHPDVYRNFFNEFYGPNNDHHSSAWVNRVGGETPEDYARYWYDHLGGKFSYAPSQPHANSSAGEASGDTPPDSSGGAFVETPIETPAQAPIDTSGDGSGEIPGDTLTDTSSDLTGDAVDGGAPGEVVDPPAPPAPEAEPSVEVPAALESNLVVDSFGVVHELDPEAFLAGRVQMDWLI